MEGLPRARCLSILVALVSLHLLVPASGSDKLFIAEANSSAIYMLESTDFTFVNATAVRLPLPGVDIPIGVEFDHRHDMIYWTNEGNFSVNRANLNGMSYQILADSSVGQPQGIALDLVRDKVYWTDVLNDKIWMANLDGSDRLDIVDTGHAGFYSVPRGMVLSPYHKKIFWTERGGYSKIEMANLDGSDRQVLTETVFEPNGITLDFAERNLYWTDTHNDTLHILHLDTMATDYISLGTNLHPFGLAMYFEDIYFSEFHTDGVYVIDYPDGKFVSVGHILDIATELHIYADTSCDAYGTSCATTSTCRIVRHQPSVHYACLCDPGYTGSFCDEDIDDCDPSPCVYGTCQDTGALSYVCHCTSGYTGVNCSMDIDDCDPSPCVYGTCQDTGALSYVCHCTSGYTGVICNIDVDDCSPDPCFNGGTCEDTGTNNFVCHCPSSHTGAVCDTLAPCQSVGGIVVFTRLNGQSYVYTEALADPMSQEYTFLSDQTYTVLTSTLSESTVLGPIDGDLSVLFIDGFSNDHSGGVAVHFHIELCNSNSFILEAYAEDVEVFLSSLEPGFWISDDGSVSQNVVSVAAFGEICLYHNPCIDGTCHTKPGVAGYWCECDVGFNGTNCDTAITCRLPTHPSSFVVDGKASYAAGEQVTIRCDDEEKSAVWRCDAVSGTWDELTPLDCNENESGSPLAVIIGAAVGVVIVVIVAMVLCFLYCKTSNRRNAANRDEQINMPPRNNNYQPSGTWTGGPVMSDIGDHGKDNAAYTPANEGGPNHIYATALEVGSCRPVGPPTPPTMHASMLSGPRANATGPPPTTMLTELRPPSYSVNGEFNI